MHKWKRREVEGREDEGLGTAGVRGMEGDRRKRGNNTRIHNLPPPSDEVHTD